MGAPYRLLAPARPYVIVLYNSVVGVVYVNGTVGVVDVRVPYVDVMVRGGFIHRRQFDAILAPYLCIICNARIESDIQVRQPD